MTDSPKPPKIRIVAGEDGDEKKTSNNTKDIIRNGSGKNTPTKSNLSELISKHKDNKPNN